MACPIAQEENKLLPPYTPHLKNVTTDTTLYFAFLQTLMRLKRAGCGLALVALKRTTCDVWQLECQASNVTASVESDHLLHG